MDHEQWVNEQNRYWLYADSEPMRSDEPGEPVVIGDIDRRTFIDTFVEQMAADAAQPMTAEEEHVAEATVGLLLERHATSLRRSSETGTKWIDLVPADAGPPVSVRVHSSGAAIGVALDLPEFEARRALTAAFAYLRTLQDAGYPPYDDEYDGEPVDLDADLETTLADYLGSTQPTTVRSHRFWNRK